MTGRPARAPRPTPHQREVLERLARLSGRSGIRGGWVGQEWVGSVGALAHLVEKGFLEQRSEVGPRGGRYFFYRPTAAARKLLGLEAPSA